MVKTMRPVGKLPFQWGNERRDPTVERRESVEERVNHLPSLHPKSCLPSHPLPPLVVSLRLTAVVAENQGTLYFPHLCFLQLVNV